MLKINTSFFIALLVADAYWLVVTVAASSIVNSARASTVSSSEVSADSTNLSVAGYSLI